MKIRHNVAFSKYYSYICGIKQKGQTMNAVSMNNLWTYLQGLALTADNWQWLADRTTEMSKSKGEIVSRSQSKKYRISPRMRKLMGSVKIDPKDIENDDRLKYILSK